MSDEAAPAVGDGERRASVVAAISRAMVQIYSGLDTERDVSSEIFYLFPPGERP